jgi:hypothetical protein
VLELVDAADSVTELAVRGPLTLAGGVHGVSLASICRVGARGPYRLAGAPLR